MDLQFSDLAEGRKVYLASDFHLGAPDKQLSAEREMKIVRWLTSIQEEAAAIFLVGDLFDFWFEYKHVIPKGFIRFQGKLAELRDRGIPIFIFAGNHDMWMFDYFETELNIPVIRNPQTFQIGKHKILIGHGDGLGPGDSRFKVLKRLFRNRLAQWAFRWLHPDLGMSAGRIWSAKNRTAKDPSEDEFKGYDEWLFQYCKKKEDANHHDYYIFGHRHLPLEMKINANSTYINLGEWFNHCTFLEIGFNNVILKTFED